jgi:hypothetical protein
MLDNLGVPYWASSLIQTHPNSLHWMRKGFIHPVTRDQDQRRYSIYHAFLPKDLALRRRHNLHIATKIVVEMIQFEQHNKFSGCPYMARGIQFVTQTGTGNKPKRLVVQTKKEIILSAGPFGSKFFEMDVYPNNTIARPLRCSVVSAWEILL